MIKRNGSLGLYMAYNQQEFRQSGCDSKSDFRMSIKGKFLICGKAKYCVTIENN